MTRSPEEERRLQALLRERERRRALEAERRETAPPPRDEGFSATRLIGGIAQDTYNGLVDTANWFGELQRDAFGAVSGGLEIDTDWNVRVVEGQGFLDARFSDEQLEELGETRESVEDGLKVDIVEDSEGWEGAARSIGGFLVPYMAAAKLMKVGQATTVSGRVGRELAAVTAVNLTVMDAEENNLANTLRDGLGLEGAMIDALATEEDDGLMEGRLKAALSNLPLELAGAALFEGAAQGIKSLRNMRAANAEQRGLIDATQKELTLNAFTPKAADGAATKASPRATSGTPTATTEASEAFKLEAKDVLRTLPENAKEAAKVTKVAPKEIASLEDVTTYIREIVDSVPPGQERYLQDLAERLTSKPHAVLEELGIDPLRLNLGTLDSPESVMAIRDGLSDMIEYVAGRSGKTGETVSWAQTRREAAQEVALSARALGTSWRAVRNTVRSTQTLRRDMMASRMLVGANAQRLVTSVDAAMAEVQQGIQHGPAWTEFIQKLSDHAVLEGSLRGAQSEVARTLNILKAPANALDPAKVVDETVDAAESALSQRYEELFEDLATDAGRIRLLNQIKQNGGDLESLSRVVKSRSQGKLSRVDAAITEAKGNLFSPFTAAANLVSATSLQAFDALTNLAAGVTLKGAGYTLRNDDLLLAGAINLNKAAAAFDAPVQAFGRALNGAFRVLGSEWLDEAAVLADTVGLESWAKDLVTKSGAVGETVKRGWLKRDMRNGAKGIYISPEYLRQQDAKVREIAERYPVGRFGQMALEWAFKGASRSAALGVNTAGALTRGSVSLFISAPDTFAGTISAQIGRGVKAVEIATEEALEAGLKGSDASGYIKGRAKDLEELVDEGTSLSAFTDAQKDLVERAGDRYAARNNFADELETTSLKGLASFFENTPLLGTMTMPFPRTPLRVMETTIIDYTPFGVLKARVRDDFLKGDASVRGEIAARYMLATAIMATAWNLASQGVVVGNDGGWNNTKRRLRGSYTVKIGEDFHDYSRLDPFGTVFGLVADAHYAFVNDQDTINPLGEEQGVPSKLADTLMELAFWPLMQNVLNKAMLDSLDNVMAISQARDEEAMGQAFDRFIAGSAARFVPASGAQRQAEKFDDGVFRSARTFGDGWLKASVGADKLPPRLDPLFGRPVEMPLGERLIGWKGGPSLATDTDRELARLAFDLRPPRRTMNGVELTQAQYNRYLQLRGHELELGGRSLEDRITELVTSERWGDTPDPRKVELIKKSITPYSRAAKQALLREDPDFRLRSLTVENRERFELLGRPREEADAETRRFAEELGLIPSN